MKTNQVLTRPMGNFKVFQRTVDGMFNATELLKQWNEYSGQQKQMVHYFENQATKEFVDAIIEEENLYTENSTYSEVTNNKVINNGNMRKRNSVDGNNQAVKKVYIKQRGGISGGSTWMHPLLFIDFAMWLNPSFKVKVLKFVYDQLIQYRIEAGDTYREMAAEIARISKREDIARNISNVASAINIIVYGRHQREIRNKEAEEQSMRDLVKMQIKVTELIKEGFIKSYDALINYLRRIWIERNQPKELSAR